MGPGALSVDCRDSDFILRRDPLGDSTWDAGLAACSNASFYHSSAWARVLHDTYGYTPHYLSIGHGQLTQAVLPIMEIDSPITGTRGISLPFTDDCEPCCAHPILFQRLFHFAQNLGRERGWRYLECRGTAAVLPSTRRSIGYFGHRVRLFADDELLFARFDSAVRRAVRKAGRSELSVELSDTDQSVKAFYELFCLTRKRHGLPPQPYSFYENIRRHVLTPGYGSIVLVRYHQKPVAGAVFFHSPDSVLMKFAASDLRYQHLRINNLALWEAMKHYGRAGYQALDFGRTSLTNEGLRNFKRRWGAEEHHIAYHRYDVRRSLFVESDDAATGSKSFFFQHLPVAVSRLAGRLLYRHMA